jgi:hypothetical protein
MTHDFDEAMNYPTAFLNVEGGYILSQELNERVKETTQFALRLAKRLMDEPSEENLYQAFYNYDGGFGTRARVIKNYCDELIYEVKQEK